MNIAILYDSVTGNTKRIAEAIKSVIAPDELVYFGSLDEDVLPDANMYFLGSWTHEGNVSDKMRNFIDKLNDKRIAYFGTHGLGCGSEMYKYSVLMNVVTLIEKKNHLWYSFMCGGELHWSYLKKYEGMKRDGNCDAEYVDKRISQYYESIGYPTDEEIQHAKCWAEDVVDSFKGKTNTVRYNFDADTYLFKLLFKI